MAKNKYIKHLLRVVACSLLFALILVAPGVYADGWIGSESGGGGFTGGGKGTTPCGRYDNMYRADCSGYSWIYYKYVGGDANRGKSVTFYNIAYGGNTGSVSISGECTKAGIEGFWHIGQNVQAYSWDSYFSIVASYHSGSYVAVGGKWGHWNTLKTGHVPSYMAEKTHNGSLGHKLKSGSTIMYEATHSYVTTTVLKDYKTAHYYVKGETYNGSGFPSNVYAFCYGPGMSSKEATYEGKTEVAGDEGDRSSAGGAYTITFTHKMRKVSSTSGYNPGSNYNTTVSGGGNAANGTFSLTNSTLTSLSLGNDKVVVSGTLTPGESKTVCQQLNYDKTVKESGGSTTRSPGNTENTCRTVSRKKATFTGTVQGKVGNTENNGNTPVTVDTATATISFQHTIKREGSADEAGGTASTNYYTTVSGKDSNNQDTSPMGTARGSSTNKLQTAAIEKGSSTTPITYSQESFTVDLLPGETKTFCQTLHYDKVVDKTNGNQSGSYTACVKVKRTDATCADGQLYGVDGGKNYGLIRVSKNSGNSWAASTPSTPEGFNYNSRTASVAAWTKPNDRVVFKSEMCEGAELSNQYYNKNISISYGITASSDDYLQDLSTRSWNNASLQGRANSGKGIFSGNSYSNVSQSPSSSTYSITNDHLGKSFSQSLSWTDLWMKDGGAIDTSHNTSSLTWTNTATATVYTPYNYTTSLHIDANRKYVLAGATADNITLSYKIEPRVNPLVNGDSAYATRSKKTKFQIFAFRVNSDVSQASVTLANNARYYADNSGTTSFGNMCGTLISGTARARNCEQVAAITGGAETDRIAGDSHIEKNGYSVSISDTEAIGTKVCIVGAVWPADSHNLPSTTLTEDSNQNGALAEGGSYWHLSDPSCFAVAKKPNFHVLSTGAYAEQNAIGFISKRNNLLFGSWSDFEIVAGGKIDGLGSGASLWGANSEPFKRACYFSSLSFANNRCNSNEVGHQTVNKLFGSDPENIYNQILTRYTSADYDGVNGGTGENNAYQLKLEGACDYDDRTGRYTERSSDGTRPSFTCLNNGSYYTKVASGDAKTENGERTVITGYDWFGRPRYSTYISQLWTSTDGEHSSNTYVVQVKGTLYINQNFRYGNIDDQENTMYTSVSEVPQTIFIAKDIKISSEVTHLDAWLLAENSIDTCYVSGGAAVSVNNCDSQLTITGPVITKKLYLNRTYGGNGGISSNSQPAEIFKLNPMVYLWGYSQTQRYMQAITTYQREMPTRY